MDAILQSLMELAGVTAVLVFDATGQLLGHRGHSVYDRALCEQVSGALAKALDAVQLQQEDWETVTAQFAGRQARRSAGSARRRPDARPRRRRGRHRSTRRSRRSRSGSPPGS